jgi:DNA-binding NarL/FixJ family response regulator
VFTFLEGADMVVDGKPKRKRAGAVAGRIHAARGEAASEAARIVVIDDHEVIRRGLREVFDQSPHQVVGETNTITEGLKLCQRLQPHVVLLDIRLEDSTPGTAEAAFQFIGQLRLLSPETRIVVFSGYDNPNYVARAMAAGAHDYLLKGESTATIIEAIEAAAAGRPPQRTTNLRRVVGMMANRGPLTDHDSPLSPRESQVLRQIALGLSNKEIAETLSISVETVKEHVQNLLRKLAVNDRTQAAIWAIREGIA